MNITGLSAGYAVNIAGKNAASAGGVPSFNSSKVYNSIGDFSNALFQYEKEWADTYADRFSGMENNGKISVDELESLLKTEFSGIGVRFVSSNPKDVSSGQRLVHIDDANLRKMANDPEYRAKNLALMQREFAARDGFSYKDSRGVVDARSTGSVFSLSEENELVGGSRYAGMGQATSTVRGGDVARAGSGTKSKSTLEILLERLAELRELAAEKREKTHREHGANVLDSATMTRFSATGKQPTPENLPAVNDQEAPGTLNIMV